MQLAEAIGATQRSISYYETDDGLPPTSVVIELASALQVTTDELLRVKVPKRERSEESPETRWLWKRF